MDKWTVINTPLRLFHPDYRGLGIHKAFLEIAKKQAVIDGATSIWCTVSKDNEYSYKNFIQQGFKPDKKDVKMYGGFLRDVLKYDVEK